MMILPGPSLFILRLSRPGTSPWPRMKLRKLPTYRWWTFGSYGAFGRLYLSGSEAEIDSARDAAIAALEGLSGIKLKND